MRIIITITTSTSKSVTKDSDLKDKIAAFKAENANLRNQLTQKIVALNSTRPIQVLRSSDNKGNNTRIPRQICLRI